MDLIKIDELHVELNKTKAILESTTINMCEQKSIDVYGCLLVILDQINRIDDIVDSLV